VKLHFRTQCYFDYALRISVKPQMATVADINKANPDTQSGTVYVPSCTDQSIASRIKCMIATKAKISVETIR